MRIKVTVNGVVHHVDIPGARYYDYYADISQVEPTLADSMRQAATDVLVHLLDEYLELWEKKQADYGYENIGLFQERGVVIRLCDKLMRLKGHYMDGREMQNESVEDTWMDCIGYGLIGLVCERGLWPHYDLASLMEFDNIPEEDNAISAEGQASRGQERWQVGG